jgi:hypothetical protein
MAVGLASVMVAGAAADGANPAIHGSGRRPDENGMDSEGTGRP